MPKPKAYIETTIPNFYFDFKCQSPEKKVETVFFWDRRLKDFDACSSLAMIRELEATPDTSWRDNLMELVKPLPLLDVTETVIALADQYVEKELIPRAYSADAVHLAIATVNRIEYLVTWNIQHLAHPFRRKVLREYNVSKDLFVPEIVTPQELNYQLNNQT
ncbi:MAG: hypothetical protein AB1352_03425 [Patescibacteria group bacterium]